MTRTQLCALPVAIFSAFHLGFPASAQGPVADATAAPGAVTIKALEPLGAQARHPDAEGATAPQETLPRISRPQAPRPALPTARTNPLVAAAGPEAAAAAAPAAQIAQAAIAPVPTVKPAADVPPPPRFDIQRYDVQGNTLLAAEAIDEAVSPHTGKSKDFGDVQRALEALQAAYQRRGLGAVQVLLPEQELDRGVVVFRVIEPRLGKVIVEGNKFFDQANVRASLPALKEGETPNSVAVGRNARLANENPSKRTTVLLRAGGNENEVDAVVRVDDEKFWRAAISLDNSGTQATGRFRLGFGYQNANLWNRDHTLTVQYQLDPEPIGDFDQLKILGVGYRIPFYGRSSQLDFLFGYSSLGSAQAQVLQGVPLNFSGSGTIFGVRYTQMLPRFGFRWLQDFDQRLSIGIDYKSFSNVVAVEGGQNQAPDVTVYPATIMYSASRRQENTELGFFASVSKNIYTHGPDAFRERFFAPAPDGVRPGAGRPTYTVWRWGVNFATALPYDTQLRASLNRQWSRDALIPGEQFGVGGWDSVRGMIEREVSSDTGYRGTFELYSPDVGGAFTSGLKLRFLTFLDYGRVRQNFTDVAACTPTKCQGVTSFGIGARALFPRNVSLRLDWGHMIDGGSDSGRHDHRIHFGLAVGF